VLSANGAYDGFVQKLDTNGNLIWIKQFGSDNTDGAYCLISDGQGHIYVSGRFGSTLTFEAEPNNISIVSAGDSSTDIYVLKMDTDGNIIWVKQMGGESSDEPVAITLDTQGNLYVCGRFFYQTDLDPQSSEGGFTSNGSFDCTSNGSFDCFYVKLDGSGTFLWAKQFGGLENDVVSDICTDAQGNMYATGRFKGTADFDLGAGTYELSTNNVDNAYILKLASDGEFIWAKSITSTLSSYCNEIAIGTQGEIYLVGSFGGTADFDLGASTHNLTSLGYGDFFLMKMNSDAELLWVEQVGANFYINTGSGIEIDDEETLYVTGTYGGAVDFGFGSASNPMTSYGNRDVFVLKMNSETVEVRKEILVADVSIYPNPANSFLNINSKERVQLVSIYNLLGELVQTETRSSFSIEHLPIGVYMINIETTLGTINERFIIE